ncbi:MAG: chitobiase/beta-hexosaminidase C-terminal domain-containing protein [Limisphaerales bacterium]
MLKSKLALLTFLVFVSNSFAGILDLSFNPGTGAGGGIIEQVLPLQNGKILVCGNFTSFNGQGKAYVARLNSDGSVDSSFTANPGYWVRNMAVQADGKIVIGGYFTTVQGQSRNRIARLNLDGSLDTSFNPGSGAQDIIGAGIDGNIDPFVFWVAVQPDGKILATGNFRNYDGASSTGIVRINSNGSRDTSFNVGSGLDSWGRHITVAPNGQILVSGWMTSYSGRSFNRIVRMNADGSPDTSFTPFFGDRTAIYCTALLDDGRIIATGHSLNYEGLFLREMARLNPNGTIDESFVGFTNEKTESAVIQSDGKVIVGGNFTAANNQTRTRIARFNPDGTLDTGFSANIDNFVWSVAKQTDGKVMIAGGFNTVDGVSRVGVARILTGAGGTPPPADAAPLLSVTGATTSSLTLSWSDGSTVRSGYSLEQKLPGGSYQAIATLGSGARGYIVSGLISGTTYIFRLRASNTSGGSVYSNEVIGTTTTASQNGANKATFAGTDSSTGGTWKGKYGAEGYMVFGETQNIPAYVTVSPSGKQDWVWNWSTDSVAALQRANGTDRLAACWYSGSTYTIDLRFNDGAAHRTAIYFLDWDLAGRNQTVRILDGTSGAVLDSRTVSNFGQGTYLIWDLAGHVRVSITPNNFNGVSSGIFFGSVGTGGQTPTVATPTISPNGGTHSGPTQVSLATTTSGAQIRYTLDGTEPSSASTLYTGSFTVTSSLTVRAKAFASGMNPSATASASFVIQPVSGGTARAVFVTKDTTTKGNWNSAYGSQGYNVFGKQQSLPAYVQLSGSGKSDWTWAFDTTDTRALLWPVGSGRIAACWYSATSFDMNVAFTDGLTHRVAVYVLDWDVAGRSQKIDVLDASTGALLNTQTVSGFSGGQYLVWDIKGAVKIRFTRQAGSNAVAGGVFFSPAGTQL